MAGKVEEKSIVLRYESKNGVLRPANVKVMKWDDAVLLWRKPTVATIQRAVAATVPETKRVDCALPMRAIGTAPSGC